VSVYDYRVLAEEGTKEAVVVVVVVVVVVMVVVKLQQVLASQQSSPMNPLSTSSSSHPLSPTWSNQTIMCHSIIQPWPEPPHT